MLHAQLFLVRHNDVLGPAKGGIRMTASVGLNEITGLAMEMTWKTSLIGVPFGGGKAGILYDPARLDADRKGNPDPRLHPQRPSPPRPGNLRPRPRHGHQRARHGPHLRLHLLSRGTAITNGCFVTGKPVVLGGIVGRREATGNGVVATIAGRLRAARPPPSGFRVAVQGFGNVGAVSARAIAEQGATWSPSPTFPAELQADGSTCRGWPSTSSPPAT